MEHGEQMKDFNWVLDILSDQKDMRQLCSQLFGEFAGTSNMGPWADDFCSHFNQRGQVVGVRVTCPWLQGSISVSGPVQHRPSASTLAWGWEWWWL
jgi:hypothetical protein